ncbi:MAG: hypothetical protein QXM69_10705 [Sulfolobaceae archaeon]
MSSQEKENDYLNIVKAAYYLFTPYIGLTAWKRAEPVSALFHSLSVALIARDVAQILTDNKDEIDLAAYGGLVHDFFQKTKGEEGEQLPIEIASEIVKTVFSNIKDEKDENKKIIDEKIIDEIIDDVGNYNIAENPRIWACNHPIAGLSIWIADTVASTSSAFLIEDNIRSRGSSKLDTIQQELLKKLEFDVVSITIPQLALRSVMYRKIYENVKNLKVVPVVARDGLVIIRDSNTKLEFKIDMNDLRPDEESVDKVLKKVRSKDKEKEYKPQKVKKNGEKFSLHESVKNALVNLELDYIEYKQDAEHKCIFCGYPVTDPLTPKWYGYTLYSDPGLETWSPRVEPLTNLNTTFREPIRKGLVSCPLCILDAFTYREIISAQSKTNLAYIIHFYFPLPTHYWLAEYFAKILELILNSFYYNSEVEYRNFVDKIKKSLDDPKEWYNAAKDLYVSRGKGSSIPLIDSTWATIVLPTSSIVKGGEFNKDLAFYISAIAIGMFFTGLYPVAFNAKVSPAYEKRLLSPVKPLYNFDPTDRKYEADTPLVITTMALLYEKEGNEEDSHERGPEIILEKVSDILRYIRYPFDFYIHILLNHEVGIKAFENYTSFRRDPLSFYKKVFPHDSGGPRPPLSLSGGKEGDKT